MSQSRQLHVSLHITTIAEQPNSVCISVPTILLDGQPISYQDGLIVRRSLIELARAAQQTATTASDYPGCTYRSGITPGIIVSLQVPMSYKDVDIYIAQTGRIEPLAIVMSSQMAVALSNSYGTNVTPVAAIIYDDPRVNFEVAIADRFTDERPLRTRLRHFIVKALVLSILLGLLDGWLSAQVNLPWLVTILLLGFLWLFYVRPIDDMTQQLRQIKHSNNNLIDDLYDIHPEWRTMTP